MKKDITGMQFGRLKVVTYQSVVGGNHHWLCVCECGESRSVSTSNLNSGRAKSCGCLKREVVIATYTKHGMAGSRTYNIWCNIKARCTNETSKDYKNYGGRGITVCKRWGKFENFVADMGEAPDGLSIDRIDNNRGYMPSNCRWATRAEQSRNTRDNYFIMFKGKKTCVTDVARILKVAPKTVKGMFPRKE